MPPSKVCPQCNAILPIRLKVKEQACKRAAESSEQTLHRQQYDREYRASMRAVPAANISLNDEVGF